MWLAVAKPQVGEKRELGDKTSFDRVVGIATVMERTIGVPLRLFWAHAFQKSENGGYSKMPHATGSGLEPPTRRRTVAKGLLGPELQRVVH